MATIDIPKDYDQIREALRLSENNQIIFSSNDEEETYYLGYQDNPYLYQLPYTRKFRPNFRLEIGLEDFPLNNIFSEDNYDLYSAIRITVYKYKSTRCILWR